MRAARILFITLLLTSIFMPGVNAKRLPETILNIGIRKNAKSLNITCETPYSLYEINSGAHSRIKPLDDFLVRPRGGRVEFDGKSYSSPVRLVSDDPRSRLRIDGRRYRDTIVIAVFDGKLTVINELGLEDYLYGILPREVNPAWAEESLKAQAVGSRTYALRNLRRHGRDHFDLCTETHCQVYGGVESEDPRTNAAVEATKGEVLTYSDTLAQTLFHAACAGHTENPSYVWSWETAAPKYLEGRKDPFCGDSPHSNWKNRLSADTIASRLTKAGYKVSGIEKISLAGTDRSGRTKMLKVKHSKGTLDISAAKFRLAVDAWLIKSTMFTTIVRYGKEFEFRGKGWGHGVGLCQWGAKGMAEKNYNYKEILHYYYPGTTIEKWEE